MRASRSTVTAMTPAGLSISSSVLNRPTPIRIVLLAFSLLRPMAKSTCRRSGAPEVQAEPVLMASSDALTTRASASISGKRHATVSGQAMIERSVART